MSNACEQCAAATDRCQKCGQPRCSAHLVVSAVERTHQHADGDAVVRARFPDDAVMDYPLGPDLTGERRAQWVAAWTSGMNVCLDCRQVAADRAIGAPAEEEQPPPRRPEAPVDAHAALVGATRAEHGAEAPHRRRHAALARRVQRPSQRAAWLSVVLAAAAGALAGGLTQVAADWVSSLDDALAGGGDPLLLAGVHRDRAGYVLGALVGAFAGLLIVSVVALRARRGRQRRLAAMDDVARRIGCGRPGCDVCPVPRAAAELRLRYPVSRRHTAGVLAASLAVVGAVALPLVALPAAAVATFAHGGVPAAIRADCAPRPPQAGDYELVCAGKSLRKRNVSRVVYRHYADASHVSLQTAFAGSKEFRACGKPRKLPGRAGRLVYCEVSGKRDASIWTTGDDVIGAALGTGAKKFARLQLGPRRAAP